MAGTAAVDVLCLLDEADVWLIEVKDFRGHRIENRNRISTGALAIEVATKVRDTLAGVVWSVGRDADRNVERIASAFVNRDRDVCAVLWVEEDRSNAASASVLAAQIKAALRLSGVRVFVTSRALESDDATLSGVLVRSRAR
jgi:hypothetical protein